MGFLPANTRVLIDVRFQKAVTADPATIFLCAQLPHASNDQDFTNSAVHFQDLQPSFSEKPQMK